MKYNYINKLTLSDVKLNNFESAFMKINGVRVKLNVHKLPSLTQLFNFTLTPNSSNFTLTPIIPRKSNIQLFMNAPNN